ncbi:MAG: hypothetical protein ABEJ43_11695 [Haloferacaceae archaeon]
MVSQRRRYLRGLGVVGRVGLAGCTGDGSGSAATDGGENSPPDDGPRGGGDTRPSGTGGPGVTVVSVDDRVDLPVQPGVEVVRETATAEHPPRLRTTLANTNDERVRVGEGRTVHFEFVADDAGALVLLPPGPEYPVEPGCWRLTGGIATSEEYRTFGVDADGSSERPVDLYARPGGDGCLPVGEYRFETTISIVSADVEVLSSAEWGFTVVLE